MSSLSHHLGAGPRGRALVLAAALGLGAGSTVPALAAPAVPASDEEFEGPAGGFSPEELGQIKDTPPAETLPPSAEAPEPPDEPGDPPPAPDVEPGTAPPVAPVVQPPSAPPAGGQAPTARPQAPAPPPPVGAQPQAPAPMPADPEPQRAAKPESERKHAVAPRRNPEPVVAPTPDPPPVAPRAPATEVAARSSQPALVITPAADPAPAPASEPPPGSKGLHVVASGESLWSIAAKHLGPGASAAEVAREVNRIWKLNASSIRSGSPDLIMVGERLRMT